MYAIFRFTIEFYREPDAHIGYLAFGWLTEGQLLCVPLALFGIALLFYAYIWGDKLHYAKGVKP